MSEEKICPHCGYCPTCGRSNEDFAPKWVPVPNNPNWTLCTGYAGDPVIAEPATTTLNTGEPLSSTTHIDKDNQTLTG